jgi:dTDP-4-dehydrorhamnose 3,5-epimerase
VVVDINPESPTCGEFVGVELTADNHLQLWIPPGYAHGFCVLSDVADFQYKCTDLYYPEEEGGLSWNDPDVNIPWPVDTPKLSEKDLCHPSLRTLLGGE